MYYQCTHIHIHSLKKINLNYEKWFLCNKPVIPKILHDAA